MEMGTHDFGGSGARISLYTSNLDLAGMTAVGLQCVTMAACSFVTFVHTRRFQNDITMAYAYSYLCYIFVFNFMQFGF